MPALSFRTKLLLAIVAVAAAATLAAMLPAQRALQDAHERALQDRFRQQVEFARRVQERRLAAVAERCRSLAGSVRLLAAMQEGDAELIYDNARDELREVLAAPAQLAEPAGAATGSSADAAVAEARNVEGDAPPRAAFVRFVADDGHVLLPPGSGAAFGTPAGATARIVEAVKRALASPEPVDVGWISVGDDVAPHLYEIVVTAIEDRVHRRRLGALVLGFEAAAGGHARLDTAQDLDLGMLVGDRLHVAAVAPAERVALARRVQAAARTAPRGELRAAVNGMPHLVFFEALDTSEAFPPTLRVGLYSLETAMAERAALRNRAAVLVALVLAGGLAAGAALAHGLAAPVRTLTEATRRVRSGDLTVRVPVRSRDELGQLSESFNEMAEGIAQKERYRHVLDVVADKEVAEALLSGTLRLGGELREASVLFCDIRGFTRLTNALAAEEVVALLNEHMTALTRVVYEHNGVVDKFVGDLLMAVFGAPRSCGNDALNAVRCARGILRERAALNTRGGTRIDVGIAVTTGEVVAGCTGSADRLSYTVLGTPVNLVSRLCGVAGPGEILIDESTRVRVAGEVAAEPLRPVELKGFAERVQAYRVVLETRKAAQA